MNFLKLNKFCPNLTITLSRPPTTFRVLFFYSHRKLVCLKGMWADDSKNTFWLEIEKENIVSSCPLLENAV